MFPYPSARGRRDSNAEGPAPRSLTGELSGFALTDREVAELVNNLMDIGLFRQVSLDFSRSRTIRGKKARGFRISFSTDLNAKFDVLDLQEAEASARHLGANHVE